MYKILKLSLPVVTVLIFFYLGDRDQLFAATAAAHLQHDARPNISVGDGYLELPVTDYITEIYSKGDNMAFVVNGVSTTRDLGVYIIDWHGDRLWSTKGKTGASLDYKRYLRSQGWRKLASKAKYTDGKVIFPLADGTEIQYIVREDHLDVDPTFDYCLALSSVYIKIVAQNKSEEGSFVRLLDKPAKQLPQEYCLTNGKDYFGDSKNSIISTRVSQHDMPPDIIEINANKVLFVDNSIAILLKPNFDFYADHPDDYHFITRNEIAGIERRAMLAVAGRLNDQPPERGNSVVFNKDAKLTFLQAEALLSEELDGLFKQNGNQ